MKRNSENTTASKFWQERKGNSIENYILQKRKSLKEISPHNLDIIIPTGNTKINKN